MSRVKKSLDDYVVYFREGKLNDASIAKELGVSRVNVGPVMRYLLMLILQVSMNLSPQ
ncbi:DUF603 domain-containing protein (plasmid) [Borrelia parkeri]|uniref:DUF603 domain-containing protein n=1 Tax=Borrelia parkeri TaxID=141 RepID=UPI003D7C2F7E|nr:DUF603 domain-containing protein [Borrelia parkeri]